MYEGDPQKWNLCIKSCVFILTCLNFSHLQSTVHLMQYTSWDVFSSAQIKFLNSLILMPLRTSAIFCFTPSTWAKHLSLRTFFYPGKQKKCCWGWDQVNREGGTWGSCRFGAKTAEHSAMWADALVNYPSWSRQMCWNSLQKQFHWSGTLPLTTTPADTLIQMSS